jgi:hypothetical protein
MDLELIATYLPSVILAFFLYLGLAWLYLRIGTFIVNYFFVPVFSLALLPRIYYLQKNSELNSNKKHIAIILCNDYLPEKMLIYRQNLKKLVKYFKKNNWAYKIYFNTNRVKLNQIINNKKATIIYIIGHGNRHGVKLNNKEMAYYCEFEKYPKKDFIALLHCTHNTGKSLVDYISKDSTKAFITNKKISNLGVDKFFDMVVRDKIHGEPK